MTRSDPSAHSVVAPSPDERSQQLSLTLSRHIAQAIEDAGGFLGFDRFMALALYAPGLGYYSGGRAVLGQGPQDGSDFVTAPELSPLFGQALARQLAQALDHTGTDEIWEFGAGTGALAEQLLGALGTRLSRYTIVDLSGSLRQRQQQRLQAAHPDLAAKVRWVDQLPDTLHGVIVGNEVLDAMPVALLRRDDAGHNWQERGVGLAPSTDPMAPPVFEWRDRPAAPGQRPATERADAEFVPGSLTETHTQAEAFITTLAARLQAGAAFFLDYGFPDLEYHLPQRTGGTVMCHLGHRADPDPLVQVGLKDITAHVNFTGIALAGQNAGWEVLGYASQGRFLLNLGLLELLPPPAERPTSAEIRQRSAVQMLVNEHEMGELFKVIGFVKGSWFDALGFGRGDRTHQL